MYDEDYFAIGFFVFLIGGMILLLVLLAGNADEYYVEPIPGDKDGCVWVTDEKRSGFEVKEDNSGAYCPR